MISNHLNLVEALRPALARDAAVRGLFLTHRGKPFSRKGLWKLIKKYATTAGIGKNVMTEASRRQGIEVVAAPPRPLSGKQYELLAGIYLMGKWLVLGFQFSHVGKVCVQFRE